MSAPPLFTRTGADLLLSVRLTPKAAHDRVDGVEHLSDGRAVLKARVRAVPEAGKANVALLRLLADTLDVPVRSLELASGSTGRIKTVRFAGADSALEARIAALGGDPR